MTMEELHFQQDETENNIVNIKSVGIYSDDGFTNIKVIGVGLAGCFAVHHMTTQKLEKMDLVAIHDDRDDRVSNTLQDAGLVIVLSGLEYKATINVVEKFVGTSITKKILTVAVHVRSNSTASTKTLRKLLQKVSSLIVIPKRQIMSTLGFKADETVRSNDVLFDQINNAYYQAVYGITRMVNNNGLIDIDVADIVAVFTEAPRKRFTKVGSGSASGKYRTQHATEQAFEYLPRRISGNSNMIVCITVAKGPLQMAELNECMRIVDGVTSKNTQVIYGVSFSDKVESDIWVHITVADCNNFIT